MARAALKKSVTQEPAPGWTAVSPVASAAPACPDCGAGPWEPGSPEGGENFPARTELRIYFQTRCGLAAPTPSPCLLVTECLRGKATGEVVTVPYKEANGWRSQPPSPVVWKTNDFCCRQMGVSSYSRLMRLQLRRSRGISSSRREQQLAPEPCGASCSR